MPRTRSGKEDSTSAVPGRVPLSGSQPSALCPGGVRLGFEEKLWQAADKMRGHMDPAEYKHIALGLVFLKFISDTFAKHRAGRRQADRQRVGASPAANVFCVPHAARWHQLQAHAKQPDVGRRIDDALAALEEANPSLRGVLPRDYARRALDQVRLGELIDLIGAIRLGGVPKRSQDILGRVYEYFLGQFAAAEGAGGGEFFTPPSVVQLLVEMLRPYRGGVYDPCCGSGGIFVQSAKFARAHGGRQGQLSVFGQESNPTTWRLCRMNLALCGIAGNLGPHPADSFHHDLHPDLKADFILANPPFNVSDWGGDRLRRDARWQFGVPPPGNANLAWVQHILHHLGPNGVAGIVLSNGALSCRQPAELAIRRALVEADLIDCVVSLPPQLFYTTPIAASLWLLARNKAAPAQRPRRGEALFIYAYPLGLLRDRTHRALTTDEVRRIAGVYRRWRGTSRTDPFRDEPGFCRTATLADIRRHRYCLVPGRYVGFDRQRLPHRKGPILVREGGELQDRLTAAAECARRALAVLEALADG